MTQNNTFLQELIERLSDILIYGPTLDDPFSTE